MWKTVFPVLAAVFAVGFGAMVGGWREADANDKSVKNAISFAVAEHNKLGNNAYISQVAEVVKVESQVVSGAKYKLTLRMERTGCKKGSEQGICDIPDGPVAEPYQCTFTVWSRPWINSIQMLENTC